MATDRPPENSYHQLSEADLKDPRKLQRIMSDLMNRMISVEREQISGNFITREQADALYNPIAQRLASLSRQWQGQIVQPPAPGADGVDLTVPAQPTTWTISVEDTGVTEAGQPRSMIRVTISDRPVGTSFFGIWLFEGGSPPTDISKYVNAANISISDAGDTVVDFWVDRRDADYTLQAVVTAAGITWVVPTDASVVHSCVVSAVAALPQPTGFSVTVETEDRAGVLSGRFVYGFVHPVNIDYYTTRIDRIRCDNTFTPIVGAEWEENANLVEGDPAWAQTTWWPLPSAPEYWKFRARTVAASLKYNNASPPTVNVTVPSSAGVAATIYIPTQPTDWSAAITDHGATAVGQPQDRVTLTIVDRPAGTKYFGAWLFEGGSPPTDLSQWQNEANQPISAAGNTTLHMWLDRGKVNRTLQILVTASADSFVRPEAGGTVHSIVIPAVGTVPQPDTATVTVVETDQGGIPSGVFKYEFTYGTDPGDEFWLIYWDRILCDNTFTPIVGADWEENASTPKSGYTQSTPWSLPTNPEYWQFRARSVTKAYARNETAPVIVNVTVPASSGLPIPGAEPLPGPVTLGTPHQDWDRVGDQWFSVVTIPVTPPAPLYGFDRMSIVRVLDQTTATNAAAINDDEGFILSDDPAVSSDIIDANESEIKSEVVWSATDSVIRIRHPEPPSTEKWLVKVTSLAPRGRGGTASIQISIGPHPTGATGAEYAPWVTGFSIAASPLYKTHPATGRTYAAPVSSWVKPVSGDYLGAYVEVKRSRATDPDKWYRLTDLQTDETEDHEIYDLPTISEIWTFRILSASAKGVNSDGPQFVLNVDAPQILKPLGNATGFTVTKRLLSKDFYGAPALELTPNFTAPDDPAVRSYVLWGKREDGEWYPLSRSIIASGFPNVAVISRLPSADYTWEFALVAMDVNGRDGNGGQTVPPSWPAGTPTTTLFIAQVTDKLDGAKFENITAAALATGFMLNRMGTVLPSPPSSAGLQPGDTFMLVLPAPQNPKFYRVDQAGTGWTSEVDGADILARTVLAGKIAASAVGSYEMSANEILVGPGSGRPVRFMVKDLVGTILCLIGEDSTIPFQGAYFSKMKVAPGPLVSSPRFEISGSVIEMEGCLFTLNLNNARTKIANEVLSLGSFGSYAGIYVESTSGTYGKSSITPYVIKVEKGSGHAVLHAFSGYGGLNLMNSSGVQTIELNGGSGAVNGVSGYFSGMTTGTMFVPMYGFPSRFYTVTISGGCISNVTLSP